MGQGGEQGTLRVLVTSVDGNADHPFRREQTVGDLRRWAYDRLVRDKDQIALEGTWMEHRGHRVDDTRTLDSFELDVEKKRGKEIDLTLALAWTSQGG